MPYSIDSSSDRCYPGTSCLMNKFDIHDAQGVMDYLIDCFDGALQITEMDSGIQMDLL